MLVSAQKEYIYLVAGISWQLKTKPAFQGTKWHCLQFQVAVYCEPGR